jgi:NAD+ kinase
MKTFGVYINKEKEPARQFAQVLLKLLLQRQVTVWLGPDIPDKLENTDLIIIIGGDGTLLEAFSQIGKYEIPLLCVNFGKTGFLSAMEPEEILAYLPIILNQRYQVEERAVMQISLSTGTGELFNYYALNDLVIRSTRLKTCRQLLKVDGKMLSAYEGDGIICATSTGSTAYSLSAGGSIIDPLLQAVIVTPICSKIASLQPLVFSFDRTIEIICDDPCQLCSLIGIDGRETYNLASKDAVRINKAPYKAKFIELDKGRYVNRIQDRLGLKAY